jgi:hypothetical protein
MKEHMETAKVIAAGIFPWVLAPEHIDLMLRIVASLGAAIYIWLKICRNKE